MNYVNKVIAELNLPFTGNDDKVSYKGLVVQDTINHGYVEVSYKGSCIAVFSHYEIEAVESLTFARVLRNKFHNYEIYTTLYK